MVISLINIAVSRVSWLGLSINNKKIVNQNHIELGLWWEVLLSQTLIREGNLINLEKSKFKSFTIRLEAWKKYSCNNFWIVCDILIVNIAYQVPSVIHTTASFVLFQYNSYVKSMYFTYLIILLFKVYIIYTFVNVI